MINLANNTSCDKYIEEELRLVGLIPMKITEPHGSEVPYTLYSRLNLWVFTRNWYYWVACTPDGTGIPLDIAENFNKSYGEDVRAIGYAGGLSNDQLKSFSNNKTIDLYHIDTAIGLKEFVNLLMDINKA